MDAQGMHPASPGGSTQCFFDSDDEEDRLVLEDEAQMWQAPGSPAPTQYGDEEQLVEEEAVWKIVSAHRVAGQTAEFKSEGFLHGFRPYRNSPKRGGRECGAVATLALISSPYTSPRQAARRRLLAQVRKSGARAKPAQLRVAVWSDLRHPPPAARWRWGLPEEGPTGRPIQEGSLLGSRLDRKARVGKDPKAQRPGCILGVFMRKTKPVSFADKIR
jgi:hypothetical protein